VITVGVRDFALFGRHGVRAHEKENGQEFVFDIELDVGDRGTSDRFDDAVDYREVQRVVQEVNDSRSFDLIEALAAAVADALYERFAPDAVRVRVTKPAVQPGTVWVTSSRP
jgi:7,8-dihydroneopterin aldolase/epimerase/oxygenase